MEQEFVYSPVRLMTRLPSGPIEKIFLSGAAYISAPIVDENGNLFILWRGVSGAIGHELVESIFMQKLMPDGKPVFGTVPKVVSQFMFDNVDVSGRQAAEAQGLVTDGSGGCFYLCGAYVMRFGPMLDSLLPVGNPLRGHSEAIWRFPSSVRFTQDHYSWITSYVDIASDGLGGALVFWFDQPQGESPTAVRAQRISPEGKALWGENGIALINNKEITPHGKAVSDGKGGAVAIVSMGEYGNDSMVVFFSDGRRARTSVPLGIDVRDDECYRIAPDGLGGMYIFYEKSIIHGNTREQSSAMCLMRVSSDGKVAFDVCVDEFGGAKELYLRADEKCALLSWRRTEAPDNPDEDYPKLHIHFARISQVGSNAYARAKMQIPAVVGQCEMPNDTGLLSMLADGEETYVLFESLVNDERSQTGVSTNVWLQKIDREGKMAYDSLGKRVHPGYSPFLVRMNGRAAAVLFEALTTEDSTQDWAVPLFTFI